ncbi:Extracellular metalloprotease [Colletotrichum sidae]|uniref:Extracellular metalloprotease n=1 Tax=Colletotrichum sidae TaxID=1347389 RepID=A0A4R8THV7_9PEZI|nr:Extracellular metalloprotease [Colletotrichum sidae]
MKLLSVFISSAGLILLARAAGLDNCGSSNPEPEVIEAASIMRDAHRSEDFSASFLGKRAEGLVVSTHLHVVEDEAHAGFVTDKMISDQMRVLNETFAPHNIQFAVKSTSHTVNDAWTRQARIKEKAEALRQGAYDELNIYFETGLMTNPNSATGICSFPVEDPWNTGINGTSWYTYDGCHVSAGTMPGGPGVPWDADDNKGKTATHEVGHWFGLFHVFDGFDCDGEGDYIDDTPATQTASLLSSAFPLSNPFRRVLGISFLRFNHGRWHHRSRLPSSCHDGLRDSPGPLRLRMRMRPDLLGAAVILAHSTILRAIRRPARKR